MSKSIQQHESIQCRNNFVMVFLQILFISFMASSILADQIVIDYRFERPQMNQGDVNGCTYDWITMPEAPNGGNPGEPALPSRGAQILIPAGHSVADISIVCKNKILLGKDYLLAPIGPPVPLSESLSESQYLPQPNETIYALDDVFPANKFENIGVQVFRGYNILILKLTPVEYYPTTGRLYYCPELKVIVNTSSSDRTNTMYRGQTEDISEIRSKVDNPEMIKSYADISSNSRDAYDLLIITNAEMADAFIPLKIYHDNEGIQTEIHAIDGISWNPDLVRDYIRDAYTNDGIEYVLIGGDDDIIRAKNTYVIAWEEPAADMPTDLYFGCLDGTYNYDGDNMAGEPGDGENGGEVDLIAEVYVGRAPVGDVSEAERFVSKTLQYLTSSGINDNKVLLCGEDLGDNRPEARRWAAGALEELIDECDENGYTTTGFSSAMYDFETLFDRDWPNNHWPETEIIARVNENYHIISHLGHCNERNALTLHYTELGQFQNSNLHFLYSQGCLAGHFDGLDCWAEYSTIKIDYGAFAAVMNARLGWTEYWVDPNSNDGPSQRYMREFWDAVLNPDENKPQLGRANHDSKEDQLYRINEGAMRWCCYETNLFGDPSVSIRLPLGLKMECPDGIPETVTPGIDTVIRVDAVGIYGASIIPASGQMHYVLNDGELQTVDMTEITPNQYEVTFPAISCGELIKYHFSAEVATSGRLSYPDASSPYILRPSEANSIVFSDNFETDLGWIATGLWERGIPIGMGSFGSPDPTSGCDGPNVFGYNLNGDYENDLPETHLTSPPIDCRLLANVYFSFQSWQSIDYASNGDHSYFKISINGTDWTTLWENNERLTDYDWVEMVFDITDIAAREETVYLRWVMGPTNSYISYCGWNIDDVNVYGYECWIPICGDANGDQYIDILDIVYLINYKYKSGPIPDPIEIADVNHDGLIDILDIVSLVNYKYKSGPEPDCQL
ncbi:MAG: hypothetical protein GY855_01995 [candidate division Zixibacteria bacterium]|nr:hypothetical protein [candidate division Zixibacteria bacterium]